MFSYLTGYLKEKSQTFVVIDVSGVGFKVYTSLTSLNDVMTKTENDRVTFYTYLYIKEGIMDLYGFSTKEELTMFELLISVSGVGAKGAVAILSTATPQKLAVSVVTNDVAAIKKASGIGPKTAQRVILELKDKVKSEDLANQEGSIETEEIINLSGGKNEAVSALIVLGYTKFEAEKAVSKVDSSITNVEDIIKAALKALI
ncbi:MAG: Holliday junction branch migration protein RuvA [Ruminococcaceae bacterium]|nr:Holliday junction branch migration protein RuvA [Oscillospiraceae bacterium]